MQCPRRTVDGQKVSIPVGFFQALQRVVYYRVHRDKSGFQSLSGFFRPCNGRDISSLQTSSSGFNPCRVFSGLATRPGGRHSSGAWSCFNPCRVFSGLATTQVAPFTIASSGVSIPVGFFQALQHILEDVEAILDSMFQSLSGFFRPCNSNPSRAYIGIGFLFQSLSGFFRPCNVVGSIWDTACIFGFNPCRVFSGLAT